MKILHAVVTLCIAAGFCPAQQYVISTVAGGAPLPTPSVALNTAIGTPSAPAADAAGNIYFSAGNCVYKIDRTGVLTRVAGTSRLGYSGDGGPAVNAQLASPLNLAVDGAGNLFIVDQTNYRIRRVSASGIITTIAGSGVYGYSGDDGPAVNAQFRSVFGMAVDSTGNIFIGDTENNRIRRISTGGIITTVAGTGTIGFSGDGGRALNAQFSSLRAVAVDTTGNLFIADGSRIRRVAPGGIITTIAGTGTPGYSGDGGPAASAQLGEVISVAVDGASNIYISDSTSYRVRKIANNGIITTVAGNGTFGFSGDSGLATSAQISLNGRISVDSSANIYIADGFNQRVRKVTAGGIIFTVAGNGASPSSGDGGPATGANLQSPRGVAVDAAGNVFIADTAGSRIRKVSKDGVISTFAGTGVYGFAGDGGPAIYAQLRSPWSLALDDSGTMYIADSDDQRIRRITLDGIIATVAGYGLAGYSGEGLPGPQSQLSAPSAVALDSSGNLYIADSGNHRVRKIAVNGLFGLSTAAPLNTVAGTGVAGFSGDGGPASGARLSNPAGVAVDRAGNLYIADTGNQRIRRVSPAGVIATVAGDGTPGISGDGGAAVTAQLYNPWALATDASGNLFIADAGSIRVRKVSPGGIISTIAGSRLSGYTGDGGLGQNASLRLVTGVAADGSGNVYVADQLNDAIRRLTPASQSVLITAVLDAASEAAHPVSPGKIVAIYGAGLGPAGGVPGIPEDGVFPTRLAGTSVTFSGIAAPLIYSSAGQVIAVVPYSVAGIATNVTVAFQGQASSTFSMPLAPSSPGLFTANGSGAGQLAAVNVSDGTLNSPVNPVKPGAYIAIYATGEGQTIPPGVDGKLASLPIPAPSLPVTATVDGLPAVVQYSGGVFGAIAGLMQINVLIPAGVKPGGYVPVVLKVGNSATVDGAVWIAVAN